jgi:6-phosphogluconolactonase
MRSGLFGVMGVVGVFVFLAACGDEGKGPAGPAGTAGAEGAAGPAASTPGANTTTPPTPPAPQAPKAVYTLSNDATSNAIFVYERTAEGTLTPRDAYSTGGKGSGTGLGDQGALVFDSAKNIFYAINNGDNSISMLTLHTDGSLALVSKVSSGGVKPVSVTFSGDVVYAVNAGDAASPANIAGFHVSSGGLAAIEGSKQPLSAANPVPAQIQFTPDGKLLVVTEKATNMIDTYVVGAKSIAGAPKIQPSAGMTPFGFAFSEQQHLIISEAFGGADGKGATSSYTIAADGSLAPKSPSVLSAQSAPCWVAIAGSHAFVTNTKSNTVTSYAISADGALTLADANGIGGETGSNPIDVDVTDGNDLLYVLNGKDHSFSIFAISADGRLSKRPDLTGLPESAVGLVAR